jgi:hypothetical protein
MQKIDQMNDEIYRRNISEMDMMPHFDIRATPTRNCVIFPFLDVKNDLRNRRQTTTKNSVINIDKESQLRNQYHALQHGAIQGIYIPNSSSDLYKEYVPETTNPISQPFRGLFDKQTYSTTGNSFIQNSNIGKDIFNNNTKTQLRNS